MIEKVIGSHAELGGWASGLGPAASTLLCDGEEITKTASAVPMPEDMEAFWQSYPQKNLKNYVFARINILGAGEYWGSNLNGDYFPEKALKEYHKTFHRAMVYVNHDHDDPEKAIGKVIFSSYNDAPYAKRVELIVAIDKSNPRAQRTVEAIESGRGIKVSMGCKVPYDRCSVCNNIAATRKQYCSHLKHEMNRLYSDGKRSCAINDHPAFFDASDVVVEADPSSGFIGKVAARIAEVMKKSEAEAKKESTIVKPEAAEEKAKETDPAEIVVEANGDKLEQAGKAIADSDPAMPEDMLETLSQFPMEKVMATTAGMQMPLKPVEITFISIRQAGSSPEARKAYRKGAQLADEQPGEEPAFDLFRDYDDKIEKLLLPFLSSRTMFPSMAVGRLTDNQEESPKKPTIEIKNTDAGAKLAAYKRDMANIDADKLACLIHTKPAVLRRITGDYGSYLTKTASITDANINVLMSVRMIKGAYRA